VRERLARFFEAQVEDACASGFAVGCVLGNLGQEMADSCEAIRCQGQRSLSATAGMFREVLEQAQVPAARQLDSEEAVQERVGEIRRFVS